MDGRTVSKKVPKSSGRVKRIALFLIQLLITIGLLAWIFREAAFRGEVAALVLEADRAWLLAALLVAGVGCGLGFVRWGIFLRVVGIRVGWWEVTRIAAVGLFFNNFLPGSVGGDAVKAGWLTAKGHGARESVLSVVMDRVSGIGALVICSITFISLRYDWLTRSSVVAATIHFVFVYLAVVVTLLTVSFIAAASGRERELPAWVPARKQLREFASTYSLFVTEFRATLTAALISVFMLLAYFLTFYFCARALGVRIPLPDFMAFMPAVDIISALPVSIGGFGVREGAFALILDQLAGVAPAEAVSLSFAGGIMTVIWGAMGILLLPSYRRTISHE